MAQEEANATFNATAARAQAQRANHTSELSDDGAEPEAIEYGMIKDAAGRSFISGAGDKIRIMNEAGAVALTSGAQILCGEMPTEQAVFKLDQAMAAESLITRFLRQIITPVSPPTC